MEVSSNMKDVLNFKSNNNEFHTAIGVSERYKTQIDLVRITLNSLTDGRKL